MRKVGILESRTREIASAHLTLEGPLLPILHAVQNEFGYVPKESIPVIADVLNLTRAEVYGVVSFYHDFRDQPAGKRIAKICRAEACQAMGGNEMAEHVLAHFGVAWGEKSADHRVTIEPVYCLGLCSLAPAALIDGEPIARCTPASLIDALEKSA